MVSGGTNKRGGNPHLLFHQLTKDALQIPLLPPFQSLLYRSGPLLDERCLDVVRTDVREGTRRVELSAVPEDEHHIVFEILHRIILVLVEALVDCSKVHRVLDLFVIPDGDRC